MAISHHHVSLISVSLIITTILSFSHAQTTAPAPGPAGPVNVTAILEKGGQYTTLIRLLKENQLDKQINSQLNNSFSGMTLLAPTDNAFNNLKTGTLNSLTQQEQVALVLFHVLPQFYTTEQFQTASNPVRTQASGSDGVYTVNITSTASQVNISTGVVETTITNTLSSTMPLAVYSIEKVLLPYDLFGVKPPTSAPAANSTDKDPKGTAETPSGAGSGDTAANSAVGAKWSSLVGLGFTGVVFGALL